MNLGFVCARAWSGMIIRFVLFISIQFHLYSSCLQYITLKHNIVNKQNKKTDPMRETKDQRAEDKHFIIILRDYG